MRKTLTGAYSISVAGFGPLSSSTLGSAISKAQTIATRVQRELGPEEECRSIYIRKLGEDVTARIDVRPDIIETFC